MDCKIFLWSASLFLCVLFLAEARIEIRTIKQGNGIDVPQDNDTVVVHYTGSLVDGRIFDSSRVPGRTPFEFVIGKGTVINGWDIGFKHMSLGQRAQLIITYDDAYGSSGMMSSNPPIYPFATLIFDVELLQIKRPQQVPLTQFQSGFSTGQQQQSGFVNQSPGAAASAQVPAGTGQFQNPGMTFGAQSGQQIQQAAGQFGQIQVQPGQVGMQQLGTQQAAGQLQLGVPQQVGGQIQLGVQQQLPQQQQQQQQQQQLVGQLQSQPSGQFDAAQASGQFGTAQTSQFGTAQTSQFGTAQMSGQFQTAQTSGQQFVAQPGMQQTAGMQASGQVAPQMRQPSSQQLGVQQGFGVQGQAVGLQQG